MYLKVKKSIRAPQPNSAFYFTRDLEVDPSDLLRHKIELQLECPFTTTELKQLKLSFCSNKELGKFLKMAPTLRMLCIWTSKDLIYDIG